MLNSHKLILAHGCFDLLHAGHIAHLQQAKAMGDKLIVSITSDRFITKGPNRPIHTQAERAAILESLKFVDGVFLCDEPSAVTAIRTLRPHIYCKGADYADHNGDDPKLEMEKQAIESIGGKLVFTSSPLKSSTEIINNLNGRPIKRTPEEVLDWLEKTKNIPQPYLVGEPIIDEYIYVVPEGKSPKELTITYRRTGFDRFEGGILAVRNHMRQFCNPLPVDSQQWVKKSRYVVQPFLTKVFSTVRQHMLPPYYVPDTVPSELVVVADFGHGLFRGKRRCVELASKAKFLALTVQSNSLNWGFNLLSKWPRADYFVVDEMELRLAKTDRYTAISDLLADEVIRMKAKYGVVTLGHEGCMIYDGKELLTLPALTSKVVDRMGAGDAFLSYTAPLAYLGAPLDIIAFVGNVAAGIKVGTIGNKEPVSFQTVQNWTKGLLK